MVTTSGKRRSSARRAQATLLVAALLIVGAVAFVLMQAPSQSSSQSPTGAVVIPAASTTRAPTGALRTADSGPILQFVSPTPENGNVTAASSVAIAVNVSNGSGLQEFSFNWNGSSFTSYNRSLIGAWSFEDLPMDDQFNGPDSSLPDSRRYSVLDFSNGSSIQGNRLMCNQSSTQPDWFPICNVGMPNRPFNGDFDVSIFTDDSNLTGASGTYLVLDLSNASGTVWDVGAIANDDTVFTYPAWAQYAGYGVSSYLRMRRMGTTMYAYAKTFTGSWTLLATKTNVGGPLTLYFRSYTTTGTHTGGRGYFDDLRVYEGQLVNDSSQLGMTPMTGYNASLVAGKYGQGVFFSGLNSSVKINDNRAYGGMDTLSVEAWMNFRGLGPLNYMSIVSKWDNGIGTDNSFFLGADSAAAKNIGFLVQTTGGEANSYSSLGMPRGNWTHLLGVYNGSKAILYVNGDKIYEYAVTGKVRNSSDFLSVGCYDLSSNSQNYFNGTIDEVRIWNRSFNEAEARELYASNLRPNGTGSGNWQFSTNRTSLTAGGNYSYAASATTADGTGTTGTRTLLRQSQASPVVNSINLTTTDLTKNDTNQNLTLQLSTSDPNSDSVTNITNWYRNGTNVMVLNMPFEGGSTGSSTSDYSGFGNTGTVTGAVWNATGGVNGRGAYRFDGSSYINMGQPSSLLLGNHFTLEAWIRPYSQLRYAGIVGNIWDTSTTDSGYALQLDGTSGVYFLLTPNGQVNQFLSSGASTVTLNAWNHVIGSYDGTTMRLYVNGVLKATNVIAGTTIDYSPANNVQIGRFSDDNENIRFTGEIDGVRIWNRTLSQREITLLAAQRDDVMATDEIVAGDVWKACVTPNDGVQDGGQVCTNNMTILSEGSGALGSQSNPGYSCRAILDNGTSTGNGWYWIDPDGVAGNASFQAYCDMTTDGGGWTRVWKAETNNYNAASGYSYINSTSLIVANSTYLMVAWSSSSNVLSSAWRFTTPASWKVSHPLNYVNQDDNVTAYRISDNISVTDTIIAGSSNFGSYCYDAWTNSTSYARTCLRRTGYNGAYDFPFFSGFSSGLADTCSDSSVVYSAGSCSDERRYVIFAREPAPAPVLSGGPVVNSINLTSTDPTTNNTDQNLTLQLAVSGDTGYVANITNWYSNGANIALLNMPFESNVNDYSGFGNNGAANGTSLSGGACVFNANSQVQVADSSSTRPTSAWSVESLVNFNTVGSGGIGTYTPYQRNPSWGFYPGNDNLNTLNDGNVNTGVMIYNSPADLMMTFNRPFVITNITVNCGQFNGDYWIPTSMTLYEGNQTTTSLASLNLGYTDTLTLINGTKGSRHYVMRIVGGATLSVQEITARGYYVGDILEKEGEFAVVYNGNLTAFTSDDPTSAPVSQAFSGTHHVAATYGSGTLKVYVDGALAGSALSSTPSAQAKPMHVGLGLSGSMAYVQLYNRTLSAHEVALLAANRTDTLANEQLAPNDVWTACVTPNDGTQDGATVCSNNVTLILGSLAISGVASSNVSSDAAVVTWTSDFVSNSSVQYGTTTALGTNMGADNSVTAHRVALSSLVNGTLHYYNVTSCTGGTCGTSGPYNFTTMVSYYPDCPDITGSWTVIGSYSPTGPITCNVITINTGGSIVLNSVYGLNITANDLTIAAGASINAKGKGCPSSQSPSSPTTCVNQGSASGFGEGADSTYSAGAGHGGMGGLGWQTIPAGNVYDSALRPSLPGSGGGSGGAGGGAVRIVVSNTFLLDGGINTDGVIGGGGGSGGSIWVEAGTLQGAGNFSSNGGTGSYVCGAGGGGRIAVYYTQSTFTGMTKSSVSGGVSEDSRPAPAEDGTMIFVDVDNNDAFVRGMEFNRSDYYAGGAFKPSASSDFNFNSLSFLPGTVREWLNANVTTGLLNLSASTIAWDGQSSPLGLKFLVNTTDANSADFVFSTQTLAHGATLSFQNAENVSVLESSDKFVQGLSAFSTDGNLRVSAPSISASGAQLTATKALVITATTMSMSSSKLYGRYVRVNATDLSLDAFSKIDTAGRGCPVSQSPSLVADLCYDMGAGAGFGEGTDTTYSAGAGHGGMGGLGWQSLPAGNVYDSALRPSLPGSGGGTGGGAGGGAIRIRVAGTLLLDGSMNADGGYGYGGGSGGSIWVEAATLQGAGNFSGNGATGAYVSGAGGGGRIAVYYNQSTFMGLSKSSVSGGVSEDSRPAPAEEGTLIFVDVDNNDAFVRGMEFNRSDYYAGGAFKPDASSNFNFNSLSIQSGTVREWMNANVTTGRLNISATTIVCDGMSMPASMTLLVNSTDPSITGNVFSTPALTHGSTLTFQNCGNLSVLQSNDQFIQGLTSVSTDSNLRVSASSISASGTQLTVSNALMMNASTISLASSKLYGRYVRINATDLSLDATSKIDTAGRGCPVSQSPSLVADLCYDMGAGAGFGEGTDTSFSAGAGHGGMGGPGWQSLPAGNVYDSALRPSLPGSGGGTGGGAGGGAIRIRVAGTLLLDGSMNADGGYGYGGGSGGSIWVEAATLQGAGNFSGNGATGAYVSGAGGGGRIAVYYNQSTFTGMSKSSASGGTSEDSRPAPAQDGTIVFVDVDNNDAYSPGSMEFNSSDYYAPGRFKAGTGSSFTFNTVAAKTGSKIRFTGTNIALNATFINFTNANVTVQAAAKLTLQYADSSSRLGQPYSSSGTFLLTIDERPYGKVEWSPGITGVNDLDHDLVFSSDNVFVNTTSSPGLNKSANVSIVTGITGGYSIMYDQFDSGTGTLCAFCTDYGLANGAGRFSTTHFSSYWLSAAHAFIAPTNTTVNNSFVFNGTSDAMLTNGSQTDIDQTIVVVEQSTGKPKLELSGQFSRNDVNLSSLVILVAPTKTVVVTSGLTGVGVTHAMYVPIQSAQGVYVCPNATTLADLSLTCPGLTRWTYAEALAGTSKQLDNLGYNVTVTIVGTNYKLAGLRGTGSAEGGATQLTIWDDIDAGMPYAGYTRYNGDMVNFYANFTNSSGLPANATTGACVINVQTPAYGGYFPMNWNATTKLFHYNTTEFSAGVYQFKVNCTGQGENLEATDTVLITQGFVSADVPEFGTWALLAALGLVAGGVVSMRSRGGMRGKGKSYKRGRA